MNERILSFSINPLSGKGIITFIGPTFCSLIQFAIGIVVMQVMIRNQSIYGCYLCALTLRFMEHIHDTHNRKIRERLLNFQPTTSLYKSIYSILHNVISENR